MSLSRKGSFALVAVLVGIVFFTALPQSHARVGGRPPSFTLPAVAGGPTRGRFRLEDHLGRHPIVILFWATWCGPCRQEMPYYQSLAERHAASGLQIVAISMDGPSTIAQAGSMARRLNLRFPILSDLDTTVSSAMNPRRAAPFSVWINREGRIVAEREGFALSERDAIAQGIASLVAP
ncbi:MAG: TlpA family protein disulfide reductase [Sandaracinaceae bacterium]|jgi:peroxiredoxin|nr:TlpA family protein disulfide reductase [Sandaracinaceae bacterium]